MVCNLIPLRSDGKALGSDGNSKTPFLPATAPFRAFVRDNMLFLMFFIALLRRIFLRK